MQELIDTKIKQLKILAQKARIILESEGLEAIKYDLYLQMSVIAQELQPCMPYVKEKNPALAIICYHVLEWRKDIEAQINSAKVNNTSRTEGHDDN
jgi:hypothetical protein